MDTSTYLGPLSVTMAYLLVYYLAMGLVALTKQRLHREYKARDEKFDRYHGQDREMLAADRIQLNMLEHMGPFLTLLWLTAVFVNTTFATIGGAVYVTSRLAYPAMLGLKLGRDIQPGILLSTGPGYLVLIAFLGGLIARMIGMF